MPVRFCVPPHPQGPLGDVLDTQQLISDVSGAGNNWAHGHNVYGPQYRDSILDKLQRTVEACDSLQSFLLLHSLGGGTGSGVGTYILELLAVSAYAYWDELQCKRPASSLLYASGVLRGREVLTVQVPAPALPRRRHRQRSWHIHLGASGGEGTC